MTNIKVGDVVQLNSGGPDMTVTGGNGNTVYATWFNGEELDGAGFPLESLTVTGNAPEVNLTVSADDPDTKVLVDEMFRVLRERGRLS